MASPVERISRGVAIAALLASAAFFMWYGMAVGARWPSVLPFFGAAGLTWTVAAVGVHRSRRWGAPFAAGLSAVTVVVMLPTGLQPAIGLFLGVQVTLLSALAVRSVAAAHLEASHLEATRTRAARGASATPRQGAWRHGGLAFAAGLSVPWLLVAGLLPGPALAGALIGLAGLALAAAGIAAAFAGRTWGLLAIAGAMVLLLAVPPMRGVCHGAAPHDVAGELASFALGLALLPWVGPVARFLRRRVSAPS